MNAQCFTFINITMMHNDKDMFQEFPPLSSQFPKVSYRNWSYVFSFSPTDGANINKSINVCTCENLADYNNDNRYNTNTSCIKRTPSTSDTLDLTDCPPEVTQGCIDGIQDLYYVSDLY